MKSRNYFNTTPTKLHLSFFYSPQDGKMAASFLFGIGVISITGLILWLIFSTEPVAQKEGATKKTPMLVDVSQIKSASYTPRITAMGIVKPAKQINLQSRVSGEVVSVSDAYVPGNILKKGEWLLQINPEDYELALTRARTQLINAKAELEIEMAEQVRARKSFEMLNKPVAEENRSLILRVPQKQKAEANVIAAESAVKEAELILARTKIEMPFDGQIVSQQVNLGSQVSQNETIAELIGTQTYWVEATVPLHYLQWMSRPSANNANSDSPKNVVITPQQSTPHSNSSRVGSLKQVIAKLDEQTRMARVLVEIDDPLLLRDPSTEKHPLIAGSYVQVEMPGKEMNDVFRIDLAHLRKKNTVWVMQENVLDIRSVKIAFKDQKYAYIENGLENNDWLITSNLSTVKQGAAVRANVKNGSNVSTTDPNEENKGAAR